MFEITNSGFVVPPAVTAGAAASYAAAAAAVALDPGLSVSAGLTLTGATVSISAGHVSGDTLAVGSPQGGITSSYNAGTGVLTLTGNASPAVYQAELDSVTFASASTASSSSRTITWSVTDGIATSTPVTSSVGVFANNSDLDISVAEHKRPVGVVAGERRDDLGGGPAQPQSRPQLDRNGYRRLL